jgi:hypothetical protein
MGYALKLSEDGRIRFATFEKYATDGMALVDKLPDGDISEYVYKNGVYIHAPLPKPEKVKLVWTDYALNTLLGVIE